MQRILLAAILLLLPAPASADVTARYLNSKGIVTQVEVDDTGLARIGTVPSAEVSRQPDYSLFTAEGDFHVFDDGDAMKVVSWHVFDAVFDAQLADMLGPELLQALAREQKGEKRPLRAPRRAGTARVAGWPGVEYAGTVSGKSAGPTGDSVGVSGDKSETRPIVISHDARLLPLAKAWARLFRSRPDFDRFPSGDVDPTLAQLAMLADWGAPLQFGDARLLWVSFDDVPEHRFTLPATPLNAEEYRRLIGEPEIVTATSGTAPAAPALNRPAER